MGRKKIQYQWDNESIIHTFKSSDGSIRRTAYIGEFDFDGNTLYTTSRLKYKADFYLIPKYTYYTGGKYLGNGVYDSTTPRQKHTHTNVEVGYLQKYDKNIPYPLGSEQEHCRFEWKYFEIENTKYQKLDPVSGCGIDIERGDPYYARTITDRQALEASSSDKYFPKEWWKNPFRTITNGSSVNDNQTDENEKNTDHISAPTKFKVKAIDKITNFNPSSDTLEIDTESFGIDGDPTFAIGKNKKKVKKKLAKQDFDFLYDRRKGGLYFNENGSDKGFGEGGIIAILKGAPDLRESNLEFI